MCSDCDSASFSWYFKMLFPKFIIFSKINKEITILKFVKIHNMSVLYVHLVENCFTNLLPDSVIWKLHRRHRAINFNNFIILASRVCLILLYFSLQIKGCKTKDLLTYFKHPRLINKVNNFLIILPCKHVKINIFFFPPPPPF